MSLPLVITFGGGKGGIGKSTICCNIATVFGARGMRVCLVDADLGGANLHTLCGIKNPATDLTDFLSRKVATLSDAAVHTAIPGARLIAGSLDGLDLANLPSAQRARVCTALARIDADVVLVDLGAGSDVQVTDFFAVVENAVVVVDGLTTSVENAFTYVKHGILRMLWQCCARNPETTAYVKRLRPGSVGGSYFSVDEMVCALERVHPEVARTMRDRLRQKQIFLVLNMVHERGDIDAGKRFTELAKTYLSVTATYIGYVIWEPALRGAVREGVPFMQGTQKSPVRACFETIADNLVALTTKES